jgi:hypothetical protein
MGTTLTPGNLQPPFQDTPLVQSGDHSPAWSRHLQDVADRINGLPALVKTGVVDGSDATAGQIGEFLTASGGPITMGSGTPANIATLILTAGDWDVSGNVAFTAAGATHPTQVVASVSASSGALGGQLTVIAATFGTGSFNVISTGAPARRRHIWLGRRHSPRRE